MSVVVLPHNQSLSDILAVISLLSQVFEPYLLSPNCCRVLVYLSVGVLVCCVPAVIWRQAATEGWFSMWQSALHLLLLTPYQEEKTWACLSLCLLRERHEEERDKDQTQRYFLKNMWSEVIFNVFRQCHFPYLEYMQQSTFGGFSLNNNLSPSVTSALPFKMFKIHLWSI